MESGYKKSVTLTDFIFKNLFETAIYQYRSFYFLFESYLLYNQGSCKTEQMCDAFYSKHSQMNGFLSLHFCHFASGKYFFALAHTGWILLNRRNLLPDGLSRILWKMPLYAYMKKSKKSNVLLLW